MVRNADTKQIPNIAVTMNGPRLPQGRPGAGRPAAPAVRRERQVQEVREHRGRPGEDAERRREPDLRGHLVARPAQAGRVEGVQVGRHRRQGGPVRAELLRGRRPRRQGARRSTRTARPRRACSAARSPTRRRRRRSPPTARRSSPPTNSGASSALIVATSVAYGASLVAPAFLDRQARVLRQFRMPAYREAWSRACCGSASATGRSRIGRRAGVASSSDEDRTCSLPARLSRHLRHARHRRGRPRRAREGRPGPSDHARLPLREGLELPRPRLFRRARAASARARGRRAPAGVVGRGARRRRRRRCRRAIDAHGGEAILPYSYAGTQGLVQGNLMSQRVMNALGASELVRTICATAGIAGVTATHGISPEVDPEEWPHARYLLLWGWNPMSTAPHLWRLLLETQRRRRPAGRGGSRSAAARRGWRTSTCRPLPGTDAALALGMMRAIRDAGLVDEDWCRAHATGLDELLERLDEWPLDRAAEVTGVPAADIERVGLDFARTQPALLRLGRGRAAARRARRRRTARSLRCRPSWERGDIAAEAAPTSRPRRPRRSPPYPASRPDLRTGDVAPDQHVAARRRPLRRPRPAGEGARRVELEPGADRARPDEGAGRPCARRTCSPSCSSSS